MPRLLCRGATLPAFLLVLTFVLPTIASAGSVGDLAANARPLDTVEQLAMPAVDHAAALAEDAAVAGPGVPLRFAVVQPVELTPQNRGTWETLADGSQLWRLRVTSPGALSLNFGFTTFAMPVGGTLVIYTPDTSVVLGPWSSADNKPHRQLWTPILPGDEAIIEVQLPARRVDELELELTSINHGYRDLGRGSAAEKSGACNIDVACPESIGWDPQVRSVAGIGLGGSVFCTGFMVNTTAQDFTPYFMTADHCGIRAGNAPSLVVYWNYFNSMCRTPGSAASGAPGDGSLSQSQSGSTYIAGSAASDYTLVMLDDMPNPAYDVYWAGWDARDIDFPSAVGIHHPRGEEKRISFENDPTTTTSYLQNAVPGNGTHVRVADWDQGTTEPGSSGSPLFSPDGYVIGQLHGGFAACGNDLSDWYGRISASWGLGLSEWLDPGNTGALVQAGADPACMEACCPDSTTLCLNGGRFKVTLDWENFEGDTGVGSVVPFGSDDSGLLWFFDPDNWEMLIKVLDACNGTGHYWVFAAATTNVGYTITVEDTTSGQIRTYDNALGNAAPALTDTQAFATCP